MSTHDRKLSYFPSFAFARSRMLSPCQSDSLILFSVVDAQIQALQKSRQAAVNADRVAADKWSLDSEIYGNAPSAAGNRYEGYVQSIPAGDEDDEPEEILPTRRAGGIPGVALEDAKAGDDVRALRESLSFAKVFWFDYFSHGRVHSLLIQLSH